MLAASNIQFTIDLMEISLFLILLILNKRLPVPNPQFKHFIIAFETQIIIESIQRDIYN